MFNPMDSAKASATLRKWLGDATINGSETGTSFRQALYFKKMGFRIHDTMIYHKENPIPLTQNRYEPCFEYMFCLSKGEPKTFNPIMIRCNYPNSKRSTGYKQRRIGGKEDMASRHDGRIIKTKEYKRHTNMFSYQIGCQGLNMVINHPAPFPFKLASDQIKSWSNEGDLIYDPFMGSGTTAIAAKVNGRNYIGSEISEKYTEEAKNLIRAKVKKGLLKWGIVK